MKPTEILMNEHRVIEQVLDCLEAILDRCAADDSLDLRSATQVMEFLGGFVERCHHQKEEYCLFPAMEANGFSGECSPVTVMLREHELGRVYVQGMRSAIESMAAGDSGPLKFLQPGRAYLNLIREHIRKEDTCLFPAANHHLAEADQQRLLAEFDKLEADEIGQGIHDRFLRLANELAHHLHVPVAEVDHQSHAGHYCH
ncbi:MAG TPA: hemerythrin domain-containing protein [Pirellulales bacterium]|nr:hemerythrin domain-containing protein [Pirellulales bacterium]